MSTEITRRDLLRKSALAAGAGSIFGFWPHNAEAAQKVLQPLPELGPRLTPELEARARGATMMIFGDYKNFRRNNKYAYEISYNGTAFHINGDGTIITNRHVVAGLALDYLAIKNMSVEQQVQLLRAKKYSPYFAGFSIGHPSTGTIPVHLEYVDDKNDFAVLRYDTTKYTDSQGFAWLPVATEKPKPGETVHHFTYQSNALNERGEFELHNNRAIYLGESGSAEQFAENIDQNESFPQTWFGASGSPVVNNSGEVCAINKGGWLNAIVNRGEISGTFQDLGFHTPSLQATIASGVPIAALQRAK